MIYYKIDMTHPQISGILTSLEKGFKEVRANNSLSVAQNTAGTVAWVKLINDVDLAPFNNAILDKALGFQQHKEKVETDIYSLEWPQDG